MNLYETQAEMHQAQDDGVRKLVESELAGRMISAAASGNGITVSHEELSNILQVLLPVLMQPLMDGLIAGKRFNVG